jgi:superfamily I DNA and/or RNA helicase
MNGTSYSNMEEIIKIQEIVQNYKNKNILILTFYNSQLEILNKKFQNTYNILCRSIDSSQGMESDIVIISLVKSDFNTFVNDPRKICVGLSRAKNKLIIVGNKNVFVKNNIWNMISTYIDNQ